MKHLPLISFCPFYKHIKEGLCQRNKLGNGSIYFCSHVVPSSIFDLIQYYSQRMEQMPLFLFHPLIKHIEEYLYRITKRELV